MKRQIVAVLGLVSSLLLTGGAFPAMAADQSPTSALAPSLTVGGSTSLPGGFLETLLAKAQPDECFNGVGNAYPVGPPCATGQAKVNQAYVWSLTRTGNTLWFGTVANTQCLVEGGYFGSSSPVLTSSYVCEFGQSQLSKNPPNLPAAIGDWRPPHIYTYNLDTHILTDKSILLGGRLNLTLGIRSAGTVGNTVFLAGQSFNNGGNSIDVYAFNATTGAPQGVWNLPQYNDIRKWLVVNGVLYTAVGNTGGGGTVLRWTGALPTSGLLTDASSLFTPVGALDADGAELALHNGRIIVGTWPQITGSVNIATIKLAGLWMSPVIPQGGLTNANLNNWQEVWRVDRYEPDPVTAATYGIGAMMSYGGALYWGTMHVPGISTAAHWLVYGQPTSTSQQTTDFLNTMRAITIFRDRSFGAPSNTLTSGVELLYGDLFLHTYVPGLGWVQLPNRTGFPRYGSSGMGNKFNNYTWSMGIYNNQLFVGTMDWSFLLSGLAGSATPGVALPTVLPLSTPNSTPGSGFFNFGGTLLHYTFGADLFRFPSPTQRAVAVSTDGLGNVSSYGIRTMVASSDGLYLGMANPMNLLTNPAGPLGGWELIKVK